MSASSLVINRHEGGNKKNPRRGSNEKRETLPGSGHVLAFSPNVIPETDLFSPISDAGGARARRRRDSSPHPCTSVVFLVFGPTMTSLCTVSHSMLVLIGWFCFASAAGLTDLCRCRLLWVLLLICSPLPAFSVDPSSAFRKAPNLRFRFHRLPRCSHHHEQTWQTP
ncbi:hypothetical protein F2Q70_00037783 [Brassica cretica]|uniref:Uncharacterized protein n=1 Tax=Brassica cretica TaxID=69181 RepID=A0A8S9JTA6_BRACR|nr:hypothetical protein F2Q70_00037783 [Brassica cretica]